MSYCWFSYRIYTCGIFKIVSKGIIPDLTLKFYFTHNHTATLCCVLGKLLDWSFHIGVWPTVVSRNLIFTVTINFVPRSIYLCTAVGTHNPETPPLKWLNCLSYWVTVMHLL